MGFANNVVPAWMLTDDFFKEFYKKEEKENEMATKTIELETMDPDGFGETLTIESPSIVPTQGEVKEVVLTQGEADIGYHCDPEGRDVTVS